MVLIKRMAIREHRYDVRCFLLLRCDNGTSAVLLRTQTLTLRRNPPQPAFSVRTRISRTPIVVRLPQEHLQVGRASETRRADSGVGSNR